MAKEKMSVKKKVFLIVDCILLAIVILLGLLVYIWYKGDSYKDFESFTQRFEIPALDDGVVPQGMANYEDNFFISNYMVDDSASRVYYIDDSEEKYVTFTYNGEEYTGHCGGIATDGNYFWMCSDEYIYTASYSDIVSTASTDGGVVKLTSRVTVEFNEAAYLFYSDGYLYAGEFYREQNYPTAESHHITTPNGDSNTAITLVYETTSSTSGFADNPSFAFSTTERIQGFAIVNGKICLSQSYGLSKSHILVYDESTAKSGTTGTIKIGGNELILYYLDSGNLINDYAIPCMSEGLCVYDGEVYVLFESAGKKYKFYVRERISNVYSFIPAAE